MILRSIAIDRDLLPPWKRPHRLQAVGVPENDVRGRSAAWDFGSKSVERRAISDDGNEGSLNCRLTSVVLGGARRHRNMDAAETASATAKDPQPRIRPGIPELGFGRAKMRTNRSRTLRVKSYDPVGELRSYGACHFN